MYSGKRYVNSFRMDIQSSVLEYLERQQANTWSRYVTPDRPYFSWFAQGKMEIWV